MSKNVVDFESSKQEHIHRKKEAKVDALRQAFRDARSDSSAATILSDIPSKRRKRKNSKKK